MQQPFAWKNSPTVDGIQPGGGGGRPHTHTHGQMAKAEEESSLLTVPRENEPLSPPVWLCVCACACPLLLLLCLLLLPTSCHLFFLPPPAARRGGPNGWLCNVVVLVYGFPPTCIRRFFPQADALQKPPSDRPRQFIADDVPRGFCISSRGKQIKGTRVKNAMMRILLRTNTAHLNSSSST